LFLYAEYDSDKSGNTFSTQASEVFFSYFW
jgi:hypothetical protein